MTIFSTPPFNFVCIKCKRPTTINQDDIVVSEFDIHRENNFRGIRYKVAILRCPNNECRELHSYAELNQTVSTGHVPKNEYDFKPRHKEVVNNWLIFPERGGIDLPSYIPRDITRDVYEASVLLDKSPRASASLMRRALQTLLRDYWKLKIKPQKEITKEIEQLKGEIDENLYKALHSLKNLAKFATHPEADIDKIIDTTKDECEAMLKVILLCIKEWYIYRHEREKVLKELNNHTSHKLQKV